MPLRLWSRRCLAVLTSGGRLVCVVGDVCLSRRKNGGRHTVVPLHSFVGDTVLDPFLDIGTTTAAAGCGRNSIGYEIDESYLRLAEKRILGKTSERHDIQVFLKKGGGA
jgi:hypothetical protein